MSCAYSLVELALLRDEYLHTVSEREDEWRMLERDIHEIGVQGFLNWLDLRERGPEPTLEEALAALRALHDKNVGASGQAQALLARVRE